MSTPMNYTAEQKRGYVERAEREGYAATARAVGISDNTLRSWKQEMYGKQERGAALATGHLHIRVDPGDKARWEAAAKADHAAGQCEEGLTAWVVACLNAAAPGTVSGRGYEQHPERVAVRVDPNLYSRRAPIAKPGGKIL